MKRHEWELPVAPERLELRLQEVTREPPQSQDREFAIRGVLLDRFSITESGESLATLQPRGNA